MKLEGRSRAANICQIITIISGHFRRFCPWFGARPINSKRVTVKKHPHVELQKKFVNHFPAVAVKRPPNATICAYARLLKGGFAHQALDDCLLTSEMILRQRPVIIGKVQEENIVNGIREMPEFETTGALDSGGRCAGRN